MKRSALSLSLLLLTGGCMTTLERDAVSQNPDHRIVVALPQSADQRISSIVKKFALLPVSTHIVTHISSDLVDTDIAHKVSNLGPVGLLDVKKKV